MKIRVDDIVEEGLDVEFQEDETWGEFLPPHGRVFAHLNITKSGDYILLGGNLNVTVQLECGRCLDPTDSTIENIMNYTIIPASLLEGDESSESRELTGDDLNLITFDGEEIDIDEVVREHIILSLPLKPLCSEQCKGLCPQCGVNKNREKCECSTKSYDHPFAALRNMKFDA